MSDKGRQFESQSKPAQLHQPTLKNSHSKIMASTNNRPLTTTISQSVKLREPASAQTQVAQFREVTTEKKRVDQSSEVERTIDGKYSQWNLIKDVNYINNLYNHVLIMISTDYNSKDQKLKGQSAYQMAKMTNGIERLIVQNVGLKEKIDEKYRGMREVHELAEYLNVSPEQLLTRSQVLGDFIKAYEQRDEQLKELESELAEGKAGEGMKNKYSQEQYRQRQQKCRLYRKEIERERRRIAKLQVQQRKLLGNIYSNQKDILKNERSNSVLKMKINQAISQEQYRTMRAKSKSHQNLPSKVDKQNVQGSNKPKRVKVESVQKLKSRGSLGKFMKRARL